MSGRLQTREARPHPIYVSHAIAVLYIQKKISKKIRTKVYLHVSKLLYYSTSTYSQGNFGLTLSF